MNNEDFNPDKIDSSVDSSVNNNNIEDKDLKENKNNRKNSKLYRVFLLFSILYVITIVLSIITLKQNKKGVSEKGMTPVSLKSSYKVAVIPVYGTIYKEESKFKDKGSDLIVKRIKKYGEDSKVKAIVLDINSPGGSVGAVEEIYSMIMRVKKQYKKPFVAHLGDVAASGGYYIASACDKIVSNSGTITGSIGVIFSTFEGEKLLRKIGLETNVIKSGKFKDIGSFSRRMTEEEKQILYNMIDDVYNSFVEKVSSGRKMPLEKVKKLADGRIYTGNQAYKLGLVDKIGDLYDAIEEAGLLSGLGKKPSILMPKPNLFDEIFDVVDYKLSVLPFNESVREFPLIEYRWAGF